MLLLGSVGLLGYAGHKTAWLPVYMGILGGWVLLIVLIPYMDKYGYLNYLPMSTLTIGIVLAIILMTHVDKHDYLSMSLFAAGFISMVLTIMTF